MLFTLLFFTIVMNSSLLVGSFYIFYFFVKTFTVFIYSFFLIQSTFLLPMPWILYLVNYLFLFYCFPPPKGFLLSFQLRSVPPPFHLAWFFSASMSLGETVNYCRLEGVFFCVRHFYIDCLCSMSLVAQLDLTYMQVTSFLGVCWQLSP